MEDHKADLHESLLDLLIMTTVRRSKIIAGNELGNI